MHHKMHQRNYIPRKLETGGLPDYCFVDNCGPKIIPYGLIMNPRYRGEQYSSSMLESM